MNNKLDNLNQRIGARIRIEREARHWSLSDLAERAGVSRAMVHKIERGDSSPTAMLLGRLSGAFGLSMSKLIARAETQEGRLMRQQDQPVWVDPDSGYIRRHVSPQSDMPLDLVRIELPAGAEIPMPASAYAFMRQLLWVLSGSLVFQEGETRHEMAEGDCLELGPPTDCVFKNESAETCIYLVVVMNKA
ncbi:MULTISPECIES: helix-turn-helix domain-containing protein [Serratia]|jgi:transcriptional regulator with XRE-family HTH domain|uniref:LacI family transcriptional regulator n=1 Tax=Serratia grimesii TaxID=82995 RepID=A0ABR4UCG5_9GAMM|nr:XRE family transcriptional regulator [Serratia grimesii]KFB89738.1 LacI family transcriptional regulator [Serratia grimesii]CAI0761801.1 anaerobic benzoate catabolism transcriptional regulator [Serratia grimesii]CAI0846154.1 anaerobic benzoate catabolism transcriptional regulator [Serratia grimesii]CAI0924368.1 anaerobic benzoate catabolism transcriptional regulator [Serratia grimesii]CAI2409116.1 anaerobic benzoate catabolism transcriptional regulator [Serratia grimesii]